MRIEFDPVKSKKNILKHGIGFDVAVRALSDPHKIVTVDTRKDYGELRYIVVGKVERTTLVVVYTMRGDTFRIISARKANEREKRKYGAV